MNTESLCRVRGNVLLFYQNKINLKYFKGSDQQDIVVELRM